MAFGLKKRSFYWTQELAMVPSTNRHFYRSMKGPIPKCGHVALVLECCYVDNCVFFSSSGSLRMRLISQFSRASEARFSETDDSPKTVVGRWILPAKLKALLGSSTLLSQVVPCKNLMAESKSPLFGIAPYKPPDEWGRRGVGRPQARPPCARRSPRRPWGEGTTSLRPRAGCHFF